MPREIFISYSTADRTVADQVCATLESSGLNCWIAPRNIEPASDWAAGIMKAIAECRVMVLIFTSKSNDSTHVVREILHAVERGRTIFPIRIEEAVPAGSLGYCLLGVQWLDATQPPLGRHFATIRSRIRQLLQAPPNATPFIHPPLAPMAASPELKKPQPTKEEPSAAPVTFASTAITELKATLATFLGPVSSVLVDRAAAKSASIAELVEQLSVEIDSPEDRVRFLKAAKKARRS